MGEKVYILSVEDLSHKTALSDRHSQEKIEEIVGLAEAIRLNIVQHEHIKLKRIDPSTYLTKGIVERCAEFITMNDISVAVVDLSLSPVQHRNLEKKWKCKVIDRTVLILEIFAERAQTHEGRLQVELARLLYEKTRLVRGWTHLERQRGGGGFTGGPGEKQLEIDRRIISKRINQLKKDLELVRKTRKLQSQSRERTPYPIIGLVGYTNAGKSTLFNYLTDSNVLVKDMLFATLDPTMRKVKLPSGRLVILSDTVGFISDLPTHLIAAFRATLEEVLYADILLHVRDISHPDTDLQKQDVIDILHTMFEERAEEAPVIEVRNKSDLLEHVPSTEEAQNTIYTSALTGQGCKELLNLIDHRLADQYIPVVLDLQPEQGQLLAWLYQHGHVLVREDHEDHIHIEASIPAVHHGKLKKFL